MGISINRFRSGIICLSDATQKNQGQHDGRVTYLANLTPGGESGSGEQNGGKDYVANIITRSIENR